MLSKEDISEPALFGVIFQNNLIGISIAKKFDLIKVNNAFCEILGYTYEEFTQKDILSITRNDQSDQSRTLIQRLIVREIEFFTIVKKYLHKSGKTVYAETNVSGVYNNGEYVMSVAIHQNISDKIASDKDLKASETLFRGLFENSPLGITIKTIKTGDLRNVNSGFCELIGYTKEELYNLSIQEVTHQVDREKYLSFFKKLKTNKIGSFVLEKKYLHKSRRSIWINTKVSVIRNAQGEPIYDFVIIEDITEQKKSEQKLIRNNKKLKKINEELDHFVYKTSHDLKSPLASILGLINVARLDKTTDPYEVFNVIETQIHWLEFFIKDIIDYSRIDNNYTEIDFAKLLDASLKDNEYIQGCDSIKKSITINGKAKFHTDSSKIKIVLNNIISNANKYYDKRKLDSYLSIKVNQSLKEATIEIADNGIGIKEEFLKSVFIMFYRATDEGEGSGLGLFIVIESLQSINGEIKLSSEYGIRIVYTYLNTK